MDMDIHDQLGLIYLEALSEVIATVTGLHLEVGSRESSKDFDDITGVMYLNGKKTGMLFVTANEYDARVVCSKMIGVPLDEVTLEDLDDTMCELVNITAGSSKLRFSETDYMFTLLQPFVIKGKDVSIVTKSITHIEAGTLTNGEISVSFKAVY